MNEKKVFKEITKDNFPELKKTLSVQVEKVD